MNKKQVEAKIKEILSKDKGFDDAKVKIKFKEKNLCKN